MKRFSFFHVKYISLAEQAAAPEQGRRLLSIRQKTSVFAEGTANALPLKLSRSIFFRRIKKFFPKVWQNTPWHL